MGRPADFEKGTCPEGKQMCPGLQSLDNIVCVDNIKYDCPINFIQIVNTSYALTFDEEIYQIADYIEDYKVVFSRRYNSRPLNQFVVDFKPCAVEHE